MHEGNMHEGILTVNLESGVYEIILDEFDERVALFDGDELSILVDGHWKKTRMIFSEEEGDWCLEGIDPALWGIDSQIRIELCFEE